MNVAEITATLSPAEKILFQNELKKYATLLSTDFSTLSSEEILKALNFLNTEQNAINTRIIQLEAKITEKENQLQTKIDEIKTEYKISDISELEKIKTDSETSLLKILSDLRDLL